MPDDKIVSWLLDQGGALGLLALLLLIGIAVLYRDNIRLRGKNEELQEKRVTDQKQTLTDLARILQGQEAQLRDTLREVKEQHRQRSR